MNLGAHAYNFSGFPMQMYALHCVAPQGRGGSWRGGQRGSFGNRMSRGGLMSSGGPSRGGPPAWSRGVPSRGGPMRCGFGGGMMCGGGAGGTPAAQGNGPALDSYGNP
eukprot:397171-Rhodomonas_salina.1